MLMPATMNLARYHLSFRVVDAVRLPGYGGSSLRGAFGRALMGLCGLQLRDVTEKTPLFLYSPYAQVFEPQPDATSPGILASLSDWPALYIVEAPLHGRQCLQPGEILQFSIVLVGQALTHLSLIILAWRRALLAGVGNNNDGYGRAELIQVELELPSGSLESIDTESCPKVQEHFPVLGPPVFPAFSDVHLHLHTPLRLQHKGRICGPREVTSSILLRQLVRRVSIFWQMELNEPIAADVINRLNELADTVTADDKRLTLKEWARFSSRQRQKVQMDGVQGHWLLRNVPQEMQQLLWLGQYLHAGKGAVFGLGGYTMSRQPWIASTKTVEVEG